MSINVSSDSRIDTPHHHKDSPSVWRFAIAGLRPLLVRRGLAPFAYTPLIPALIASKWLSPSDVAYLSRFRSIGFRVAHPRLPLPA
jgi:hypothetical protein